MSSAVKTVALSEVMIGSLQTENCVFTVLRRRGDQSKFDIAEIVGELAHHSGGDGPLFLLFEWSEVSSWPFQAPSASAIRDWKKRAPLISRAALVHNQKLTRHAAILAALMRVCDAEVRSFHPPAYDGAVEWLAGGLNSSTFDGSEPHGDHNGA